jgi:hypothetical protein
MVAAADHRTARWIVKPPSYCVFGARKQPRLNSKQATRVGPRRLQDVKYCDPNPFLGWKRV